MGFGDALGNAFENVGDATGKGLGFVLDAARWGLNSETELDAKATSKTIAEHVRINKQRAKQGKFQIAVPKVGDKMGGDVDGVDPITDGALKGLERAHHYTMRGIGTAQQVGAGNIFSAAGVDSEDPGWAEAWKNTEKTSAGQIAGVNVTRVASLLAGGKVSKEHVNYKNAWKFGTRGEDEFDPVFAMATGSLDLIWGWYADPTIVGGKAVKAQRLARTEIRPGDVSAMRGELKPDANRRERQRANKVRSRFEAFLHDTDGRQVGDEFKPYSASELMEFKAFKDNAALASVIAKASGDHDLKRLVMLTAHGDTVAKQALVEQRADIARQIDKLNEDLSPYIFREQLATANGTGLFDEINSPEAAADIRAEIAENQPMLDLLNRALPDEDAAKVAKEMGTDLDPQTLGVFKSVGEQSRVTGRDRRLADQSSGFVVQNGLGGTPIRAINSPTNKRPEGVADVHDGGQTFTEADRMLRRVTDLNPEVRQKWLDQIVHAPDDNARKRALVHMEERLFAHIGRQFGYEQKELNGILAKMMGERDGLLKARQERAYASAVDPKTGKTVDMVQDEAGVWHHRPISPTQLANEHPMLDVDAVYRVLKQNSHRIKALRHVDEAWHVTEHGLANFNDLWKLGVLLRGGYAIRSVTDNQIRQIAYLGGLAHAATQVQNIGQGVRRKAQSKGKREDIETQIAERRTALGKATDPDDVARITDEIEALDATIVKHFGQGETVINGRKVADAFGRSESEYALNRARISSGESVLSIASTEHNRALNKMRGSGNFVTKQGSDPGYADDYLRVVNQHFRQHNPIMQRLLAGEAPERVAAWLKSSEGRQIRRRMVHRGDSAERLVGANLQELEHLIPNPAFRSLLKERPLTTKDLDDMFGAGQHTRPPVNAEQIMFAVGKGPVADALERVRTSWFKYANQMPDDVMGRHPMYRQMYRARMKQMMDTDDSLGQTLTAAEQRVMEEQARVWARREVTKVLFDVSTKSDLSHFLRFASPFFSAWEDTMVKYGRLVMNDPSLLPRAWQVWTAPNDTALFEVTDADGNPVAGEDSTISDGEFIKMPAGFLGKAASQGFAMIPKSGFNTILQGDPFWLPGFGPYVQAPVNVVANDRPELADALRYILPYGTSENSGTLFLPTTLKNANLLRRGTDDRAYTRIMNQIGLTEKMNIALGKREFPGEAKFAAEIKKRTDAYFQLKIATAALSPASVQYKSPYQFYIDQVHALEEQQGEKIKAWHAGGRQGQRPLSGDEAFLQKYGEDYYIFTTSLSKNVTGIRSSHRADKAALQVKDLITEHKEYGWFFVGPDNTGEHNQNVYNTQQLRKISPTSSETWRGSHTPAEAQARTNAELGWTNYQKLTAQLEAIRVQRGLSSMQVKGAKDLRDIKARYMDSLEADPNNPSKKTPAWAADWLSDFGERNSNKTGEFLAAARAATQNKKINGRKDIQTMAQYLEYRTAIREVLAARKAQGGSDNIFNKDLNSDLAAIWATITGRLVDQDIIFADVYSRVLENDDLMAVG